MNLAILFSVMPAARARANVVKGALNRRYQHDPEKWEPVFGKIHAASKNSQLRAANLRPESAVLRAVCQITANSAAASGCEKLAERT